MLRLAFSVIVGMVLTLASSFVGERSANATYPDIMGCETGCRVTATGWPLVFVRDYTGMSVVNTANVLEVWFAADRFDWQPFLLDVIFWGGVCLAILIKLNGPRGISGG
jgi:hypothetical protein